MTRQKADRYDVLAYITAHPGTTLRQLTDSLEGAGARTVRLHSLIETLYHQRLIGRERDAFTSAVVWHYFPAHVQVVTVRL